jgi:hypothetical protein
MVRYKDIPKGAVPGIFQLKIRYKGVWDMQDLYESTINWLRERKYKFHEKVYKHKHPSPYGSERQYVWMAEQVVDDFVQATIDIYIHTYDAHDIEALDRNGERKLFTKGKIWAYLKIYFQFDHEGRFDKNSFWGNLRKFYQNYVIKKRIMQNYSPRFRNELVSLHKFMMQRLHMETKDYEYKNISGVHRRPPI